ncbi:YveK family protein [Cohnella abietis]|uniref:Putative capsular polysaccharide biosynthesis protein YwqC n=1 Tax=Cohnella abietis TaxID=2507935 RepID=A0A3T1D1A6_9BACL|nr:Wzz/FepE/Etk N-terminal domain-containing protein [Cohnella abietis]BBI31799.1 putative capsular polysaccharide biosynthesis protein YwqC [Cohnella abietis]
MELKQYWAIVWRRKWIVLLLVLIGVALTSVYSMYFVDKQFLASTKIIVNQKEYPTAINQDPRSIDYNINLIKTYKEIIKTPRIMSAVVKQYPDLKISVSDLIDKVSVSTVNGTQVMSVVAMDTSYKRAAQVANAVSQVFQQEIPLLMNVDNVNILNEADVNALSKPHSPNTELNIVLSTVLFLVLGLGLAFLLEYLDDTVRTELDLKVLLELPTFAHIPRVKANRTSRHKKLDTDTSVRRGKGATFSV